MSIRMGSDSENNLSERINELQETNGNLKSVLSAREKEIDDLKSKLKFYRNEFCLKCGKYRESYRGKCDGCYFYEEWRGDVQ